MRRRDLIIGGFAAAGALGAEALRPRKRLLRVDAGTKIADIIPIRSGPWSAEAAEGLVQPPAGALAKSLYNQIVQRTYFRDGSDVFIMALAAYGDTQSDLLQLHRPEACYPAVGFSLTSTRPYALPIGHGAALPVRKVVATQGERVENIVYWTRIGDDLPQSSSEQRRVRLVQAMHGFVADGLLMRFSVIGEPNESFALLEDFVPRLLADVPSSRRVALVGAPLARKLV